MFFQTLQRRVHDAILRRPKRVLAAAAVLSVVGVILGSGVEFRTSRSDLAPDGDPEQRRFDALMDDYDGSDTVIAGVEPTTGSTATREDLRRALDGAAARWAELPSIRRVFHRVDVDWLLRRGLHLAPPAKIEALAGFLDGLGAVDGIAGATESIARRLEAGLASGSTAGGEQATEGAEALRRMLAWERRFVEDPDAALAAIEGEGVLEMMARRSAGASVDGSIATSDGRLLFAFLTPADPDRSLPAQRRMIAAVREVAREVERDHPGVRVVLGGRSAMAVEEMDAVRGDTWKTSVFALVGVTFLTFLVFRWKTHSLLVLVSLGAGVVWSFGAVRLEYGYLNMITSAFISTLIGVGVAYGIHPMSEYELEGAHSGDAATAVDTAWGRTGAAVATSGVTTSAAFFSILLMQFRGFAELGLVAGVGVLLCLLSFLVVLPCLALLYGRRRGRRDRAARTGRAAPAVDRLWVERGATAVCRFPRTVTAIAAVLSVASLAAVPGIGFDIDLLALLPAGAQSVEVQRRMVDDDAVSPLFSYVVASDVEELRGLAERAEAEPTIAAFQSVLQFLPRDPAASAAAVDDVRHALEEVSIVPAREGAFDPGRLRGAVARVESALLDASDAAFTAGLGEAAGALEDARAEAEGVVAAIDAAGPDDRRALAAGDARLRAWAAGALAELRAAAASPAPSLQTLPATVRDRFVTRSGRLLGMLLPAGDVFDAPFLSAYVAACRRVSPESTGFPIVFERMAGRITQGFYRAVAVGAVLVFVILLLDYRDLGASLLAMIPLTIGVLWMLGGMRLFGLSFNFANLVGIPLILGVGIDNGVHVVHRLRLEGEAGMSTVLRHTGRAILIASLTTMIGFGSLALASHQGIASLGKILLLGVGACLVTSMVVLPNLLVATRRYRR